MGSKLTTNNSSIPKICLGTWEIGGYPFFINSSKPYTEEFIETAIENDITFFDTSPIYGLGSAERILGKVQNKVNRNEIMIATKGGLKWSEIKNTKPITYTDNSKESLRHDLIGSLERLKTDYIDIYQIHWPEKNPATPIDEIVETLEEFRKEGLIHRYGLSNHSNLEIKEYLKYGSIITSQNRVDFPMLSELYKLRKVCSENNILLMGYGLLQNGLLTNTKLEQLKDSKEPIVKYMYESKKQKQIRFATKMRSLSRDIGLSVSQMIVSYALNFGYIDIAVIGTKSIQHVITMKDLMSITDIDILKSVDAIIKGIV